MEIGSIGDITVVVLLAVVGGNVLAVEGRAFSSGVGILGAIAGRHLLVEVGSDSPSGRGLNVAVRLGRAHTVFILEGTVPADLSGADQVVELSRALTLEVSEGSVGAKVVGARHRLTADAVIAGVFGAGLDLEFFFKLDGTGAKHKSSEGEYFDHLNNKL